MKMCDKCQDHNCMYCEDIMASIDYYLAEMQLETGLKYCDLLDAVQEWSDTKIKEWNKYKVDTLEPVREMIKEGKI